LIKKKTHCVLSPAKLSSRQRDKPYLCNIIYLKWLFKYIYIYYWTSIILSIYLNKIRESIRSPSQDYQSNSIYINYNNNTWNYVCIYKTIFIQFFLDYLQNKIAKTETYSDKDSSYMSVNKQYLTFFQTSNYIVQCDINYAKR